MSSLKAASADNYYFPPEWTPDKGSINKYQKSHPLGVRAKKLKSEGILVVRFEVPFNIWCTHCDTHIGRGVRYNAEKKKVGKYFSTTIWEFQMKCATCKKLQVIQTDPENRTYKLVSGVRKKEEEFTAESAETLELTDKDTSKKLATDPLFKLEHLEEDRQKARAEAARFHELVKTTRIHRDDYEANFQLRKNLRKRRRDSQNLQREAYERSLGIPLLQTSEEDRIAAAKVVGDIGFDAKSASSSADAAWQKKMKKFRELEERRKIGIKSQSIFGGSSAERDRKLKALEKAHKRNISLKLLQLDKVSEDRTPSGSAEIRIRSVGKSVRSAQRENTMYIGQDTLKEPDARESDRRESRRASGKFHGELQSKERSREDQCSTDTPPSSRIRNSGKRKRSRDDTSEKSIEMETTPKGSASEPRSTSKSQRNNQCGSKAIGSVTITKRSNRQVRQKFSASDSLGLLASAYDD